MTDEPKDTVKTVKADPLAEAAALLEKAAALLDKAKGPRTKSYQSIARRARDLADRLAAL